MVYGEVSKGRAIKFTHNPQNDHSNSAHHDNRLHKTHNTGIAQYMLLFPDKQRYDGLKHSPGNNKDCTGGGVQVPV
jgi:hypothetical protein